MFVTRTIIAACAFAFASTAMSLSADKAQAQQPVPAQTAPPAQTSPQASPAQAAPEQPPPEIQQIALTDKQVQSVLTAQKDLDAITDKLPEGAADKPDPKLAEQFEGVVKKYGFASYAEYGQVIDNISLVMSGMDPKTKVFTDPPTLVQQQIAAIEKEPKMPATDKQTALAELKEAAKYAVSVKFPENVTLVKKYYDQLAAALEEDQ